MRRFIIAGSRPPEYIRQSITKHRKWVAILSLKLFEYMDLRCEELDLMYPLLGFYQDIRIISGGAKGADEAGEIVAAFLRCEVDRVDADWDTLGKSAGMTRNHAMADLKPERVILIWDGKSPGTAGMKAIAEARGIPVHECVIQDWSLGVK